MATVTQSFPAINGELRSTGFPQLVKANGTSIPVSGYAFDAATEEAIFLDFEAAVYGSGNVTVRIRWYADTATTGNVMWGAQLAAITPGDAQDVETKALATAATATGAASGTAQGLVETTITITALDSLAAGDTVRVRVYRVAADAADTMAGDAICSRAAISYSDT